MQVKSWDDTLSTGDTNEVLLELAQVHAQHIQAAHTRELFVTSLASRDFPFLCDYTPAYEELSVNDAIHVRQITAFFSKRGDLDIGRDKRRNALIKWEEAEAACKETNEIFRLRSRGEFNFLPRVEAALFVAQRKIAHILGPCPGLDALKPRFGPGATTQVQKRTASARRKLSQTFACSEEMLPYMSSYLQNMEFWVFGDDGDESKVVDVEIHASRLSFALKNATTYRTVGIEPSCNVMWQLAIGDYMAGRLRKFGLDIRTQEPNRKAALRGSLTGEIATLDQVSASDMQALELVWNLLPIDWGVLLSSCRSGKTTIDGQTIEQHKFSSMGNGYTFALETLIFYALALSVVPDDRSDEVRAFGDDIVIPTEYYRPLVELLTCAGFKVNTKKSFAQGRFRESCGADYLKGIDIRPVYIHDRLQGRDLFRLHNGYVRKYFDEAGEFTSNVLRYISPDTRIWGPDGYGDGHLVGDYQRVPFMRNKGWSGHIFETFTFKAKAEFARKMPGDYVFPSYSTYLKGLVEDSAEGEKRTRVRIPGVFTYHDTLSVRDPLAGIVHSHDKAGRLGVSIPGRGKVNRIKIYVLN